MILEYIERLEGDWTCRICDYKSKRRTHVTEHIEMKHIDDGCLYYCTFCNHPSKSRNLLRMHVNSKHPGIPGSNQNLFY